MTDAPQSPATAADTKAEYLKAQKKRNLFIGLALVVFVALVFFISMARMAQGLKKDATLRAMARAQAAASASK